MQGLCPFISFCFVIIGNILVDAYELTKHKKISPGIARTKQYKINEYTPIGELMK